MRTFVAFAFVLALAVPASAGHCTTWSTTQADHTFAIPGGGVYYGIVPLPCLLAHDLVECGGIWVYEETNGIPGLQRADVVEDDTCHGLIPSDTIIV